MSPRPDLIPSIGRRAVSRAVLVLLVLILGATFLSDPLDKRILIGMSACERSDFPGRCREELAHELVARGSFPEIFTALERHDRRGAVFARCHELAHYLGRELYRGSASVGESFAVARGVCHGGIYHGVLEEFLGGAGGAADAEALFLRGTTPCRDLPAKPSTIIGECYHGLGHALMFTLESELPKALSLCDSLSFRGEEGGRKPCHSGAFMENSSGSTDEHPSPYRDPERPLYPCDTLAAEYLSLCYLYQGSYFVVLARGDFNEAVARCGLVPAAYRERCFFVMGTNAVGHFAKDKDALNVCSLVADSYGESAGASCRDGVVSALGGKYPGDARALRGLCDDFPQGRERCFALAGEVLAGWFDGTDPRRYCAPLKDLLGVAACITGASRPSAR